MESIDWEEVDVSDVFLTDGGDVEGTSVVVKIERSADKILEGIGLRRGPVVTASVEIVGEVILGGFRRLDNMAESGRMPASVPGAVVVVLGAALPLSPGRVGFAKCLCWHDRLLRLL